MNEILFPTASCFSSYHWRSQRLHAPGHVAVPATQEPVGFSLEALLAAPPLSPDPFSVCLSLWFPPPHSTLGLKIYRAEWLENKWADFRLLCPAY